MIQLQVQNTLAPIPGRLLLAEPFMLEEVFSRSIIYLCKHDAEGSFGFVLNKIIPWSISDILPDFPLKEMEIHEGGPVCPEQLYYLHTKGELFSNCELLENGLFMGGDYKELLENVKIDAIASKDIRFFVGYSGWSKGQLEQEIKAKSWLVVDKLDINEIMNCKNEEDWKQIMKRQGSVHKKMTDFPKNPTNN